MAILGIDISKDSVDAMLLTEQGSAWKKVSNNVKGFEQLKRWLKNRKATDVHACMEATGSTSIEGVGDTTASLILAEAPRLHEFHDAKAVAAFAGLSSHTRTSGTSVRGRGGICKIGNSRLRRGLWWPAIVAIRHNARLRAFAQKLRLAGKPNKKIIIATMRKLLVFAFGVLKTGTVYRKGPLTASC